MSIETTTTEETTETPPPIVEAKANGKSEKKKDREAKLETKEPAKEDEETSSPPRGGDSSEIKKLKLAEDATLREIVEALGDEGSFGIKIWREEPEYWPDATGKKIGIRGYLETVQRKIDEDWIQKKFGGGTYKLTFRKKGGSYITHRTITIAGEPDISALPKSSVATPVLQAPQQAQDGPIVTKALDMMQDQLAKAQERAERGGGGSDMLVAIMREQLEAARAEKAELMREMAEIRAAINKPAEKSDADQFQSRLLDKMIDQDTARLQAVRIQYDSEIRALKESAREDEKRMHDRYDREMQQLRNGHERELAMLRQSHETAMATLRSSHEVSLSAAKQSYETQTKLLEADNRRLERDNNELRDDVKELRSKKEKTIVEQAKDLQAIKEALDLDGDGEDKGALEKIMEAAPDIVSAVGGMIQKGKEAPAAQQAPVEPARPRRMVVRNKETGEKMILEGNQLRPAKKSPAPGTPPEVAALPPMDDEEVKRVVGYLESACQAGTDPALVVQSYGSFVPEAIKVAIRDLGGVDHFLTKVAKLPSSSPLLANQSGRNWVRKLGKALAGE